MCIDRTQAATLNPAECETETSGFAKGVHETPDRLRDEISQRSGDEVRSSCVGCLDLRSSAGQGDS